MKIKRSELKRIIENYLLEESKEYVDGEYIYRKSDSAQYGWEYKTKSNPKWKPINKAGGQSLDSRYGKTSEKPEKEADDSGRKVGVKTVALGNMARALAQNANALLSGMNNWVTKLFIAFVSMRTSPITANSLSSDMADCLRIIAADAEKHGKLNQSGAWGDDADYQRVANSTAYKERFGGPSEGKYQMDANMKGAGSIRDSLFSTDVLNNIYNSFTHFTIRIDGENIRITDQYDFNPAVNILGIDHPKVKANSGVKEDPEFFKDEENFYNFLENAMDGKLMIRRGGQWRESNFFSREAIENLCRFYEGLFAYKGVPIDITISKESPNPVLAELWDFGSFLYDFTIGRIPGLDR